MKNMSSPAIRVCMIGNTASIHFRKWVGYFVQRGYKVHCITCSSELVTGADTYRVGRGLGKLDFVLAVPVVLNLLRRIRPELVHVHYMTGNGLMALPAFLLGIPVIASGWGSDILMSPKDSFIARQVVKILLARSAHLIGVSEYITREMEVLGANAAKISVLPVGVDTHLFTPSSEKRAKEEFQVVSLNAHEPLYRIELLIQAVRRVLDQGLRIKAVIVGQGSQTHIMKELVSSYGISDHVSFPGRVSLDQLLELLRSSQVYISMAESAGTPVSLLEAMSCGAFPILSDIPGHSNLVQSGQNGILIPNGSVQKLSEALIQVLQGEWDFESMIAHNRNVIIRTADWQTCMSLAEQLYHNVAQKG